MRYKTLVFSLALSAVFVTVNFTAQASTIDAGNFTITTATNFVLFTGGGMLFTDDTNYLDYLNTPGRAFSNLDISSPNVRFPLPAETRMGIYRIRRPGNNPGRLW